MDSRNIIGNSEDLTIAVDTESIDAVWGRSDVERILRHYDDNFDFVRTPGNPDNTKISQMPVIQCFDYPQTVEWSCSDALDVFQLSDSKRRLLVTTMRRNGEGAAKQSAQDRVILTDDADLLNYRYELDPVVSQILYPGSNPYRLMRGDLRLNIATPKEVIEIMGLSKRRKGLYEVDGETISKSQWLNYMTLLRLPHLGDGPSRISFDPRSTSHGGYLSAIKTRAAFLIAGLDHIGVQYYTRTSAHSNNFDLSYYVDYCLSLVTSMLDNLALYADKSLSLGLDNRNISLNTRRNNDKKFTTELKKNDHDQLCMHIHQNHHFTNIAYIIRNGIVHREGIMKSGDATGGGGGRTTVNGEQVSTRPFQCHQADLVKLGEDNYENVVKYYENLSDSVLDYDPVTKWGLLSDSTELNESADKALVNPYQMVKTLVDRLLDYADEFLSILGQSNIHDTLGTGGLSDSLDSMQESALTPLIKTT